jgi:hypothetical protein
LTPANGTYGRAGSNMLRSPSEGATVGLVRLDIATTTMRRRAGVYVEIVTTLLVELRYTDESVSGGRACVGRERGGDERAHQIML